MHVYMQTSCHACAAGEACLGRCHAGHQDMLYMLIHAYIHKHTYIHTHICRHRAMDVPREGHVQCVAMQMTLQESRHATHAHTHKHTHKHIHKETHTHVHTCRHRAMDVPREGHVQDVAMQMALQESRHAIHAHTQTCIHKHIHTYANTHTYTYTYAGIVRWMCHGRGMSRMLP